MNSWAQVNHGLAQGMFDGARIREKIDLEVARGDRCAKVRTGWLCGGGTTKLATCFVVGECDETA
jgi:hypothetical protein